MSVGSKVDKVELFGMLRSGITVREAAKHFGVSPGRISQISKELSPMVAKAVTMEVAHKVAAAGLDVIRQIERINRTANGLLDQAIKAEDHMTALGALRELRGQLALQLDIIRTLADVREIQQFQTAVLDAVGHVAPEVREAIISGLQDLQALRKTTTITTTGGRNEEEF